MSDQGSSNVRNGLAFGQRGVWAYVEGVSGLNIFSRGYDVDTLRLGGMVSMGMVGGGRRLPS